jgi:hypothetical protein
VLAPDLEARDHRVLHGAGGEEHRRIGLVEEIVALRRVVVAQQRDVLSGRVDRPGKDVLVELVVVGHPRLVANAELLPE